MARRGPQSPLPQEEEASDRHRRSGRRDAAHCPQRRVDNGLSVRPFAPNICALQILRAIADDDESIWGSIRKLLRENDGRDTRSYLESLDRWDKRTIS